MQRGTPQTPSRNKQKTEDQKLAASGRPFCCVPSMNDSLEVEVLYPA